MIDAGPLLCAILANAVLTNCAPLKAREVLTEADKSLSDPENLLQFLASLQAIRRKHTTSHVIAEVNSLLKTRCAFHDRQRGAFGNNTTDLLTQWGFDERLMPLLSFSAERIRDIAYIGIVDTGLIRLSQQLGATLLTLDARTLRPMAPGQGLDCVLLSGFLNNRLD